MRTGTACRVGTLLSVNVGLPREVAWRGGTTTTAIGKRAVPGRVAVTRLNVAGDGQADLVGHGGEHRAVFVYQEQSYRYWERELGRELRSPGRFGENFTVSGLDDGEVRIGDRLRIGSAVFEVTQPRVTCYKVGLHLDEPRMPALLTGHGRPGFYLRVLQEGEVGAGDPIVRVARDPEGMTVREVSALLYLRDHDVDRLRQALRITALPPGWRASFRALVDADGAPGSGLVTGPAPVGWPGFRSFTVEDVRAETATVRSVVLVPSDGRALPAHRAGQYVGVRLSEGDGAVRSYTVSAAPDPARLRISVRHAGAFSERVHRLRPGDRMDVAAPRGDFTLDPAGVEPVVLISGGIGVTPLLAMLAALSRHGSHRPVAWLHVTRSAAEHAFVDETAALLATVDVTRARVHYTAPTGADLPDGVTPGRPTASDIAAFVTGDDAQVYVCGPGGFMTTVRDALLGHGVAPARLHSETFGGAAAPAARPPHPPVSHASGSQPLDGTPVTFARSGLTVRWDGGSGSLLDLAEACDVPVSWSCRSGVCHRCETGLVTGEVDYAPQPLDAPPSGTVLLCCATPRGPVVLDV